MEGEHDEVHDDCQNKRELDDDDDDDDAPLTLLATTETTATVVVQQSCDNNRTISTTTTNQHPTSTNNNSEAAATTTTTTTTNPSVVNRKTRRRNETKNSSSNNDAYHTAYQKFRYQFVYFTYDHNHTPNIRQEASAAAGPSSFVSKAIVEYHIHQSTTATIRPIPTPPPGTPLCYFKASYLVRRRSTCGNVDHDDDDDAVNKRTTVADMIVHQHVNGLCVVCVANPTAIRQQPDDNNQDGTFHYHVSVTSSELSLAQKRKRNTKQLQGKKNDPHHHHHDGLVQPCDTLATWTLRRPNINKTSSNAVTMIRFPCCVMGSILELNERFRTDNHNDDEPWWSLLESDPYGTGYLAIILPSGPFPPPS